MFATDTLSRTAARREESRDALSIKRLSGALGARVDGLLLRTASDAQVKS